MPSNLFQRLRAPAFAHFMGVDFYFSDALAFDPQINPFGVPSDAYGDLDQRYAGRMIKFAGTPIGAWTSSVLPVVYPFANYRRGQFNTPVYTISNVNTGSNALTATGNSLLTGTGVRFFSTGTLPAGLVSGTTYYVVAGAGGLFTVADTEAHALANSNIIDVTSAGTGTIKVIQNSPLTINFLDGNNTQITLWNAALANLASLNLSNKKTPIGKMMLEAYALAGTSWTDDDSVFTIGEWSGEAPEIDASEIPTVPYTSQFGDSAPFSDLEPRDGVVVDFDLQLEDVISDSEGVLCKSIDNVSATAKLRPTTLEAADVLGEIVLQGSGAGIGVSLPSNTLSIFGPDNNPFIALYGASLMNAPLKIGAKEDLIDVLNFKTKRTFVDGVAQPIFYVGTEAPS